MDRLLQLTQERSGERRNDPRFHVGWQLVGTEIDRAAARAVDDADNTVLRHIKQADKSLSTRRAKTHPKIAAVIDAMLPLLDAGEKVIVFCHHRATASEPLNAVERHLRAESVSRSGPPERVWRAAWESLLPDEDSLVTPIIDCSALPAFGGRSVSG